MNVSSEENSISWTSFETVCPGVIVYRDVLRQDLNVIDTVEKYLSENQQGFKWSQALVGFQETMLEYRDCFDFKFNEHMLRNRLDDASVNFSKMHAAAVERQNNAVKHYCSQFGIGELKYWEATNFVKYGPGQHFAQHADHGFSYNCTVSLVGWPNDDYEGGELEFPTWGIKIKPQIGDLAIFPSNFMYQHRSLPVLSGTKYSLVTMLDYSEKYHTNEFRGDFYGAKTK
jgi:hypothetical protein